MGGNNITVVLTHREAPEVQAVVAEYEAQGILAEACYVAYRLNSPFLQDFRSLRAYPPEFFYREGVEEFKNLF